MEHQKTRFLRVTEVRATNPEFVALTRAIGCSAQQVAELLSRVGDPAAPDLHVVSEQQEGQTGDQLVEHISDIRWITLSVLKDNGRWAISLASAIVVNGRLWVDRPQFDVLFAFS